MIGELLWAGLVTLMLLLVIPATGAYIVAKAKGRNWRIIGFAIILLPVVVYTYWF